MSVTQSVQVEGREEVFVKLASMYSDNRKREREYLPATFVESANMRARIHSQNIPPGPTE